MTVSRAEQKRLAQQQRDDWKWLGSTPNGRRILRELIAFSGLMTPSTPADVVGMAVAQGQRIVGSYLYAQFTGAADPASLPAILAEVMTVAPSVRPSIPAERDEPDTGR